MEIENRKARHDYFITDTLECGIELQGHEVKSIKNGSVSLKEAWCTITPENELMVLGMHITKANTTFDFHIDEKRNRRLLAHKAEIIKWGKKVTEAGFTIVPLKMYFTNGRCKVLIGLCKGKHNYDKRNSIKERDVKRQIERSL